MTRARRTRCNIRTQSVIFFFFNDTATTEIYTLSLHDALPISGSSRTCLAIGAAITNSTPTAKPSSSAAAPGIASSRSEEHTSELQSPCNLVCRLLLEKKKDDTHTRPAHAPPPQSSGLSSVRYT